MKLIIKYQIADNVPPAGALASRQKWGLRLLLFFCRLPDESMRKSCDQQGPISLGRREDL